MWATWWGPCLLLQPAEAETPVTQLHVALNWFEELKQKARGTL